MTGTMTIDALLAARRSTRGFLPDPVPLEDMQRILQAARKAPSGANLQPGRFHALTGAPLAALTGTLAAAIAAGRPHVEEYSIFPDPMPPELHAKRRAAGYALYAALGIDRGDFEGRRAQFDANYRFFDAPVGLVVTIRRDMGKGCFMDLGMAIMALMLAAQGRGYATCGIGALSKYADVVHEALALEADEMVVCGMALGRADPAAPANGFATERDPLELYATFSGFDQPT